MRTCILRVLQLICSFVFALCERKNDNAEGDCSHQLLSDHILSHCVSL